MKKWLLLSIIFLFSPGCKKNDKRKKNEKILSEQDCLIAEEKNTAMRTSDFVQQEARLTDVPIPLNAKPIPQYLWIDDKESAGVMLAYIIPASARNTIVSFYSQEMERFGWEQIAFFNAPEQLLIFQKPGRICSISLRPTDHTQDSDSITLVIFTGKTYSSE